MSKVERGKERARARAKVRANSARELEQAPTLTRNIKNGLEIYRGCAACHGAQGEGDAKKFRPRIQAQHYDYLVTRFEQIRADTRQNANPEMVAQIKNFEDREMRAVLEYVSRLQPPEELQAPPGWSNPDFDQPIVLQSKR